MEIVDAHHTRTLRTRNMLRRDGPRALLPKAVAATVMEDVRLRRILHRHRVQYRRLLRTDLWLCPLSKTLGHHHHWRDVHQSSGAVHCDCYDGDLYRSDAAFDAYSDDCGTANAKGIKGRANLYVWNWFHVSDSELGRSWLDSFELLFSLELTKVKDAHHVLCSSYSSPTHVDRHGSNMGSIRCSYMDVSPLESIDLRSETIHKDGANNPL